MTHEQAVSQILTDFGLSTEKLPEIDSKQPDFLVCCDTSRYLIELKEKFPEDTHIDEHNRKLDAGEVVGETNPMGYRNSISGIVRDGVEQLISDTAPSADFRVLWIHCQSYLGETLVCQALDTLYGIATIIDWATEDSFEGQVFYFDESEFFKHRKHLDGAIVSFQDRGKICLNNLSPNYESFKKSGLVEKFSDVLDPGDSSDKKRIVLDTDIDRRSHSKMIRHLVECYGLVQPQKVSMQSISASVMVPSNET